MNVFCARRIFTSVLLVLLSLADGTQAAEGPLGIDHRPPYDNTGIWQRRNQLLLEDSAVLLVFAGALWEGDDTRLGHTLWQSVDSIALGAVTSEGMKYAFSRSRPAQADDPNRWFQGRGNKGFPSGEVMVVTTAITPIVLEYASEHPAVWTLEILPLYDAVARVKARLTGSLTCSRALSSQRRLAPTRTRVPRRSRSESCRAV